LSSLIAIGWGCGRTVCSLEVTAVLHMLFGK
jgi:hypothetical protein